MRLPSLEGTYTLSNWGYSAPGGNTAADVEIPAIAGNRMIVVRQIFLSVRGDLNWTNVQYVKVTINAATAFDVTIPKAEGVYSFEFPWGLYTTTDNAEVVTVATSQPDSGPSGTELKLNVCWEYV